jgi:glycosyltransferase involved in cell wall biosynthesis
VRPTISVIISYYNQKHYADALLNNISSYASQNVEVIISDDCSSDGSELYFNSRISSPFVKYIRLKNNVGPRLNADQAAKASTGRYLIFSAGDDFMLPKELTELAERINCDTQLYICGGFYSSRHEVLNAMKRGRFEEPPRVLNRFTNSEISNPVSFMSALATRPGYLWLQGVCLSRALFDRAGFLPSGEIDDWGLLHNLTREFIERPFKIEIYKVPICAVCANEGSFGRHALKQAERQLSAVVDHWHPNLNVEAFHQVMAKKLLRHPNKDLKETRELLNLGIKYLDLLIKKQSG